MIVEKFGRPTSVALAERLRDTIIETMLKLETSEDIATVGKQLATG